jgi:hypothetical protein
MDSDQAIVVQYQPRVCIPTVADIRVVPGAIHLPLRFDSCSGTESGLCLVGGNSRSYVTSSSVTTQLSRKSS